MKEVQSDVTLPSTRIQFQQYERGGQRKAYCLGKSRYCLLVSCFTYQKSPTPGDDSTHGKQYSQTRDQISARLFRICPLVIADKMSGKLTDGQGPNIPGGQTVIPDVITTARSN